MDKFSNKSKKGDEGTQEIFKEETLLEQIQRLNPEKQILVEDGVLVVIGGIPVLPIKHFADTEISVEDGVKLQIRQYMGEGKTRLVYRDVLVNPKPPKPPKPTKQPQKPSNDRES